MEVILCVNRGRLFRFGSQIEKDIYPQEGPKVAYLILLSSILSALQNYKCRSDSLAGEFVLPQVHPSSFCGDVNIDLPHHIPT